MPAKLTRPQIAAAATEYHVDPAALRAVIAVETGGRGGFLPDGRCKILFERHILWKRLETRGIAPEAFAAARPDLCGERWNPDPKRGGYAYGSEAHQWDRVAAVIAWGDQHQDRAESYAKAAWEACSWGLFQVMGFHYADTGYQNIRLYKAGMESGEPAQLAAALRLMDRQGLIAKLRARDWSGFTLGWNGSGQVETYSAKLAAAFALEQRQ